MAWATCASACTTRPSSPSTRAASESAWALPPSTWPRTLWLLKSMDVADVRESEFGVTGTLYGELGACPEPGTMPVFATEPAPSELSCGYCGETFTVRPKGRPGEVL